MLGVSQLPTQFLPEGGHVPEPIDNLLNDGCFLILLSSSLGSSRMSGREKRKCSFAFASFGISQVPLCHINRPCLGQQRSCDYERTPSQMVHFILVSCRSSKNTNLIHLLKTTRNEIHGPAR
jgi:hypothetical protein